MGSRIAFTLAVMAAGTAASGCMGQVQDGSEEGSGSRPEGTGLGPAQGQIPVAAPPPPGAPATGSVTPGAVAAACRPGVVSPGPSPLRRLNRFEIDNTVRDLLGDSSQPAQALPPDGRGLGFDTFALALNVSDLLVSQYVTAAEQISVRATANLTTLLPCRPATDGEDTCARRFIDAFGKKAWRRPLADADRALLFGVYDANRDADFTRRIQLVIQTVLLAPDFLYRVELGAPGGTAGQVVRLTSWEMASRLSYLFWGSLPDDELFRAAEAGQLATKEQVAAQARRLLRDPRARPVMWRMHEQWLRLEGMETIQKDASLRFNAAAAPLMKREAQAFVEDVLWNGPANLATLLTAPYSFMNRELATFYGTGGGVQGAMPAGATFARVDLDASKRIGLLTQAGVMALLAHAGQTSPVRRGLFVREALLGSTPPPPPPDANQDPPRADTTLTTRERYELALKEARCAGCHALMNPIGFGLENYDAAGRWRTTENGKPIDVSGEIVSADVAGRFVGPIELVRRLAGSKQVANVAMLQFFRYGYGREESDTDACTLATLAQIMAASGASELELMVGLTQTDAFLYKRI